MLHRTSFALPALLLTTLCSAQTSDTVQGGKKVWGTLGEKEFAALHELKEGATPKLHGKDILVGKAKAYLSLPKKGKPTGAVLVIHEWWGLNANIKHWADRIAAEGYAALAIDLYGGVVATTRQGALEAMRSVDPKVATETLAAAHTFLAKDPRVQAKKRACIGWCFGGAWSLRHAIAAKDLDAAVIYYGRLVTDAEKLRPIQAPVLGVFGKQDRSIPPASVTAFQKAMKTAGKRVQVHSYPANHAFANPSSARYEAKHAGDAWQQVRRFLARHLATQELVAGVANIRGIGVDYRAPKNWRKGRGSAMRAVTLKFGETSECYIVGLPGMAGGGKANINRWRGQMGQKPLSDAALAKLEEVPMLGGKGTIVRIDGKFRGMRGETIESATMFGAIASMGDQTVFIKMIGPKSEVGSQGDAFKNFCRSLKKKQ